MLSNKVLRFLDRTLKDICNSKETFGGKVIILGGDWKQLAPVVENDTKKDQLNESIKLDPLYQKFEMLRYI